MMPNCLWMEELHIQRDLIKPEKWDNRILTERTTFEYQLHAVMQVKDQFSR